MMIKNIVFDIGNVMLKWDPMSVVVRLFPGENSQQLTQLMFKSSHWLDLNLGKISEAELITIYHQSLSIDLSTLTQLMFEIKESLLPIEKSFELLAQLHQSGYALYALTDNVHEIMNYLKRKYDFWEKFNGIVVSAEVGYLKPAPQIYHYLMTTYHLKPEETVLIDDHLPNVNGAKLAGMHAIQFKNAEQCMAEMIALDIVLKE